MAGERPTLDRRQALIRLLRLAGTGLGAAGLGFWLSERSSRPSPELVTYARRDHSVAADTSLPEMAIVQGEDPAQLVRHAVDELGGMHRFIARGDIVVIKPNAGWDRTPEQAANTNPDIVADVVRQCWSAGAKRVIVTDVSCNDPRRCFQRSGIGAAALQNGAEVILPESAGFQEVDLQGDVLRNWPVLTPFLMAMKNWFGILGGPRHQLHQRIHESLVDLADFMRPTLTIMDCYRVLIRNGPTGGNPEDVALKKCLVAGTDPVALDAWVAKAFWNLDASSLAYLTMAAKRGLGTCDFQSLRTRVRVA